MKANNSDNLNLATSWTVAVPATTDVARWDSTVLAANTTLLGANLTFASIAVTNPGGSITINAGNALTLGSAAKDIDMTDASADLTLNCGLTLGAANVWEVAATRTLTVGGAVSGSFTVTKNGAGGVVLTGNNTYTGTTAVSAGKFNALHANALGDVVGDTTVASGATLALQGGISYAAESLSLASGSSPTAVLQSISGNNTWTGAISTSGTGSLARISSDADLFTLANTLTGSDVATSVVLQGNGNILVSGKITGASGLISSSFGAGIRTLTNTGNDFTGNVAISGGTLALGTSNVLPNVPISIAAGTLDAATFTDSVGTLTVTGAATINLGTGATLAFADSNGLESNWTGTLNITGNFISGTSIKFATTGGLTGIQLGKIKVNGGGGPFTLDDGGYLTGPTGGNYQSWATANGVTGGVNGDSDNDGVSNLVEYALVDGGERGVFVGNDITFTKRGAPIGSDITYGIETSETLASGSWTNAVIGVTQNGTLISYTFSPSAPVKKFARLKVTQIP